MKHKSNYAMRLQRRKSAGTVRTVLPVARQELVTMKGEKLPMPIIPNEFNKGNYVIEHGAIKTRTFERLRRADELELV